MKKPVTTNYGSGANMVSADSRVGIIELVNDYPTNESVEKLYNKINFQRASQAYIWAWPMMATQAFVDY